MHKYIIMGLFIFNISYLEARECVFGGRYFEDIQAYLRKTLNPDTFIFTDIPIESSFWSPSTWGNSSTENKRTVSVAILKINRRYQDRNGKSVVADTYTGGGVCAVSYSSLDEAITIDDCDGSLKSHIKSNSKLQVSINNFDISDVPKRCQQAGETKTNNEEIDSSSNNVKKRPKNYLGDQDNNYFKN